MRAVRRLERLFRRNTGLRSDDADVRVRLKEKRHQYERSVADDLR